MVANSRLVTAAVRCSRLRANPLGRSGHGVPGLPTVHFMGTTLDQRYVLDTQIASGAVATVWRALDRATGVPVAVKRLRPEAAKDPQLVDAFLAEAEVLADLDHPGLVPITDFVSIDGEYALIMELVDGRD